MPALTPKTGIHADTESFGRQIRRFAKEYNLNIGEEMTNQMRLWCGDNIKNFPPAINMSKQASETKKEAKLRLEIKSDQALGKRAVARDISRIIIPMTGVEIATTREMGPGMFGGHYRFETKNKRVWLVEADLYKQGASQSDIEAWHRSQRRRDGRVSRAGTYTRDIGRWKAIDKLHVREKSAKAYTEKQKKKVGKVKSGWVAGLVRFGGKLPAKWIRQNWFRNGSAGGSIDVHGNGVLWAVNRVKYASEYKRISDHNLNARPRLALKAMKRKADQLIKEENARRVA